MINDKCICAYRLPGYVAGYYTREQCHIDLLRLCSFAKVRFIKAEANDIDTMSKTIKCKDGRPPISYDITSIDIGITPKLPYLQNNQLYNSITPVKPIDGFCSRWDQILSRVLGMGTSDLIRIVVVGGGAGGVELCLAVHHRLTKELSLVGRNDIITRLQISIVNRGPELMSSHSIGTRRIMNRLLANKGIQVLLNTEVVDVVVEQGSTSLVSSQGERIQCDEAIWCTSAQAQSWLRKSGLDVTTEGFINVQDTLESVNTPDVFACGDVCHIVNHPRPKAGVFAVKAGTIYTFH
jgi:selenide,water dikinase